MEIPIYLTIAEFKENYGLDYSDVILEMKELRYYSKCKKTYIGIKESKDIFQFIRNNNYSNLLLGNEVEYVFYYDLINDIKEYFKEKADLFFILFNNNCTTTSIEDKKNREFFESSLLINNFDIEKFRNFHYLIKTRNRINYIFEQKEINPINEIIEYIDQIIYNIRERESIINISNTGRKEGNSSEETLDDIPENDFSDTVPLERMIILEKLGIIKYIQSIQNDSSNEKQTADILSAISGINSGTIAKNLGVMLGVKKNDTNRNSPYNNPKNLNLANNKLYNFNINFTKIIQ